MVVIKKREQEKIEEKNYVFLDLSIGQIFKCVYWPNKDCEDYKECAFMKISAYPYNAVNLMTGRLASFINDELVMVYSEDVVLYQDKFTKISDEV